MNAAAVRASRGVTRELRGPYPDIRRHASFGTSALGPWTSSTPFLGDRIIRETRGQGDALCSGRSKNKARPGLPFACGFVCVSSTASHHAFPGLEVSGFSLVHLLHGLPRTRRFPEERGGTAFLILGRFPMIPRPEVGLQVPGTMDHVSPRFFVPATTGVRVFFRIDPRACPPQVRLKVRPGGKYRSSRLRHVARRSCCTSRCHFQCHLPRCSCLSVPPSSERQLAM